MRRLLSRLVFAALLASVTLLATDGPRTNLMNLRGRTDENGYLRVSGGAVGATDGPLTALSNLRGRTDENGYLRVAMDGLTPMQGTLTSDAQAISTSATWNSPGTTFTHWKAVITDTASAAGSMAVSIKGGAAGTTNLFSLNKIGAATFGSFIYSSGGGTGVPYLGSPYIGWLDRSLIASPSDGVVSLLNNAGTDFSRLQGGGVTSSFPSWKRSGAGWVSRLADDSANTFVTASFYNGNSSSIIASAGTIAPTGNIHHISGTAAIATITVPAGCTPTCVIYLVPDGIFTTTTAGNISLASTAVVNKVLMMVYDGTKWNPSY